LIAALNKYYRPITKEDFYLKMDLPMINNAVQVAQFPESVECWIWEKDRQPFSIF
jgi:hypothetical protein